LKDIPVIALTAHGTMDCLFDCLAAGASGFLVKPPTKTAIRKELQKASRILVGRGAARLVRAEDVELLRESLGDGDLTGSGL
jgi:FixJ family two-component response regulator